MSSGKWRPFCLGLNVLNFVTASLQGDVGTGSIEIMISKIIKIIYVYWI